MFSCFETLVFDTLFFWSSTSLRFSIDVALPGNIPNILVQDLHDLPINHPKWEELSIETHGLRDPPFYSSIASTTLFYVQNKILLSTQKSSRIDVKSSGIWIVSELPKPIFGIWNWNTTTAESQRFITNHDATCFCDFVRQLVSTKVTFSLNALWV